MGSPLELWLHQQLGVAVARLSAVGGGCIHRAWCVELADGQRWFAKTNRATALPLLQAEADGLGALAAMAPPGVVVPLPLASGVAVDQAVLVHCFAVEAVAIPHHLSLRSHLHVSPEPFC